MNDFLKRKYGPFEVWQWALMLIGGIIVGLYLRARSTPAPSGEGSGSSVGSDSLPGGHSALGAIGVPYGVDGEAFDFDMMLESQYEIFAGAYEAQQEYYQTQLDKTLDFFDRKSIDGTREDTELAPSASGTTYIQSGSTVEERNAQLETNQDADMVLFRGTWYPRAEYERRLAHLKATGELLP